MFYDRFSICSTPTRLVEQMLNLSNSSRNGRVEVRTQGESGTSREEPLGWSRVTDLP